MTHNVQGFLLCWYSVIRQSELSLIKVTEDQNILCRWVLFVKLGLKLIYILSIKIYSSASIAENPFLAAGYYPDKQ
jgi:hypothetical protein